ncbi:50S ribosomal protein L19 [Candidatus Woesebacteria bacterium CG22_combo_CG10-13_8_21_14_all_39_10]|uniref:50S ribosomal protein L19 n=4 Tax=Candidatus Woeseibacteriota TaxID=1752722 RepID=A0A2M7XA66_9BACT|nr:MAG: 50S ribosomal protein L19 [Candidatus Woesebacteria bacterium CG22_combo_CG10-13_8_21_14_all_39_10]PIU71679.1 MAG: 50S ribosomal protein L19 [Candidatus Woesebacteria bacterium CG06_land_8_20_14_3_00_39_27]PIZ50125.1 MAG: 50S ribosomal protein L19 [Candidatus Woesebacteria bacterium CG_4_10_14_0_2_um_filter_39_14]PJA43066.1 MAG: 50S ribosomal protein L19 [Candidatus Woesebacteria bacterium CG_4_9_14_3_um_filter_39_10]
MPLFIKHKDVTFGIGDRVRVTQKIVEAGKNRSAIFEGIVISIKSGPNPSFIVRRIGEQQIGIERIFPINLPSLDGIKVIKKGTPGVKHGKLFYLRGKNPHEIEKIYTRAAKRVTKKYEEKNK